MYKFLCGSLQNCEIYVMSNMATLRIDGSGTTCHDPKGIDLNLG